MLIFAAASRTSLRAFSTTSARSYDLSKLVLIGRLGRAPEPKTSKTNKEYVSYTVATTNYPPPPVNADGTRPPLKTSWHHVLSFNESANGFLKSLEKGTRVYVEANFELQEPDHNADPSSPEGHKQIYLRHETIRVLSRPHRESASTESASTESEEKF